MVSKLMFIARWTRPDVLFAVRCLSKFTGQATPPHMKAMYRVMKYLLATRNRGIVFQPSGEWSGPETEFVISGWCDSDFANDTTDRKSITGSTVFLNDAPISEISRSQALTSEITTSCIGILTPTTSVANIRRVSRHGSLRLELSFGIGKLPGPPVLSSCNLDPNVQLFEPFKNIAGELKPPDFFHEAQGEFSIFWGTTADGVCGTAQHPPSRPITNDQQDNFGQGRTRVTAVEAEALLSDNTIQLSTNQTTAEKKCQKELLRTVLRQ